jgi:S-formylglutathione hydrolase FrmB
MYFDLDGSNVDLNVDQVVGGSTTTHTIATFTASDLGTSPFEYRIHVAKVGTSAWVYPMFNQEIPSGLTDTWPFEISTVGLETGAPGIVLKESSGGDSVKSTRMALDQYFEHTTWDDGEDPDGTTANAGYNHITHSSSTMGIDVGIAVITPPNYSVNKSYGCLIFLHGSGGNENILVAASTTPPAEHAFDYMDGGGTEYIICSVNAGLSLYLDPVSGSIEDGHDVRSFITGELLTYLSNNWSVDTDRIVIGGFSMGCYGAMSIWLDNRDKFIGCAGFSPPVQPDFEQQYLAERKSILNYQPGTTGRTNVEAANLYTQIVSAGTPEFFIRTSDADSTNALFNSWKTVAQSNGATFDHTIYSGLPHSIDQQMDQDASDGYEYWTYVGDTVGDPVDIDVDSNILLSGRMTSRMTERLI